MLRAKAMKLTDNESFYNTDLRQVNFVKNLPVVGEPMYLLTGKISGGVRTSLVEDINWSRSKYETRYEFKTMNSTYLLVIDNNDLKDWEEFNREWEANETN